MRERGLKLPQLGQKSYQYIGRSREGAWIEMRAAVAIPIMLLVAPVRERGLKL